MLVLWGLNLLIGFEEDIRFAGVDFVVDAFNEVVADLGFHGAFEGMDEEWFIGAEEFDYSIGCGIGEPFRDGEEGFVLSVPLDGFDGYGFFAVFFDRHIDIIGVGMG